MTRATPQRRRGMMLLELMGALVLLGAFSLLAAQLYDAMLKASDHARPAPPPDRRRAALIERFRADLWGAAEIGVVGGRDVVLRLSGDRSIFWRRLPGDAPTLERSELRGVRKIATETWGAQGGSMPERFEPAGKGVRIVWPDPGAPDGGVVEAYSQIISLTGERR